MDKLTKMKLVYIKVYGIKEYDFLLELLSLDNSDCNCGSECDCLEATIIQTVDLLCENLIPLARIECLENAAEFHMLMQMVKRATTEAQVSRILYSP